MSTVALAVSYDVVTEKAYGCFYSKDGSSLKFASIDKKFNVTEIANISTYWLAAAFDGKGNLYAIDGAGFLKKVNITDGTTTNIGSTGLASGYYTSGTIDPRTGIFYFAYISSNSEGPTGTSLYTIDLTNAKATKLYDFAGVAQLYGMFVAPPITADEAPAAVSNITFDFEGVSLAGKVKFDAPTLNYAGEPATGDLTYTIVSGKDTVATGATAYGAKAAADVTFPTAGKKSVTITVKSEAGTSPALSATSGWIGPDTPKAVTGATVTEKDGRLVISWKPVTTTTNSGYINKDSVKYNVSITAPETKLIAEGISDTTCVYAPENPEEFKTYSFRINALANGKTSSYVNVSKTIGRITPPFVHPFSSSASFNGFTVIDANNDKETWKYYGSTARLLYQNKRPSDDYLITPAMNLEANKIYTISVDAKGWDDKSIEKFRIVMGEAPTVEGMNKALSDTITFIGQEYKTYTFQTRIDKSGVYYFGVHGISPNMLDGRLVSQAVYLRNIDISAPIDLKAPQAPEIAIEPDTYGALKALVKVKAPAIDNDEKTLTQLDSIVLKRGGKAVHTFKSVAPGQEYTWTDETPAAGNNSYEATAYNASGASPIVTAIKFIGHGLPLNTAKVNLSEEGNTGKVTLTWDPVTEDVNGLLYKSGDVKYTIYDKTGRTVVAKDLTDTSYTFEAMPENETDFVIYYIATVTAEGTSASYTGTDIVPVGKPYAFPYKESYPGGNLYSPLGYDVSQSNMCSVSLATDETLASLGVKTYDGDNGFLSNRFWATGISVQLYTAKIDLTNAKHPAYQVATYAFMSSKANAPRINQTILMIRPLGEKNWKPLKTWTSDAFDKEGWHMLTASLEEYKGKLVQVGIQATCTGMTYSLFDAMSVYEVPDYDLEAVGIEVPETFVPNAEQKVSVEVKNNGCLPSEEYTVELYLNGKSFAKTSGPALASDSSAKVDFPVTFNPLAETDMEFYATVNYDKDSNKGNNATEKMNSKLILPELPVVEDLAAKESVSSKAELTWSAPSNLNVGSTIGDSFENYTSFEVDKAGEWSFIDGDKKLTYKIDGTEVKNIPYTGSYIVLDSDDTNLNATFDGHTGTKSLACFNTATGNDDWAISPELNGFKQTVKFFARSYTTDYGQEEFEFYYSKTGKEKSDFVKVGDKVFVPGEWTEYSFTIPEGAKYFAVRCISNDKFILMLDDFTFVPKGAAVNTLAIDGYNLYRDAVKINENLLTATTFTDDKAEKGEHTYHITVAYKEKGESAASNPVTVTIDPNSGINSAEIDGVKVVAMTGGVIIYGAAGEKAVVIATDGRIMTKAVLTGETRISLVSGVYLIKIGKNTVKVIVK